MQMEAQTPCSRNILGNFRHHTVKKHICKHKCADWLHQGVINGPCPSWCHEGLHRAQDIAAHCWACSSEPSHSEQEIEDPLLLLGTVLLPPLGCGQEEALVGLGYPGGPWQPASACGHRQHPHPFTCFSLLSCLSGRYLNSFKGIFFMKKTHLAKF